MDGAAGFVLNANDELMTVVEETFPRVSVPVYGPVPIFMTDEPVILAAMAFVTAKPAFAVRSPATVIAPLPLSSVLCNVDTAPVVAAITSGVIDE